MTKHDELTPKCPIELDEAYKLRASEVELLEKLEKTALAIPIADPVALVEDDAAAVVVKEKTGRNMLAKVVSELYDLESYAVPEKPIKITLDLDLYQMETP